MLDLRDTEVILYKLKKVSGYDLTNYAIKSIIRRLERFLINERINKNELIVKLNDENFAKKMMEEITVNTTDLFRDPEIWQFLRINTLEKLRSKRKINIWLAGISKGQEVYSLMMLLNELELLEKSHIIATDVNDKVLSVAKKGHYKYRNNLEYISNFDKVIKRNPLNYKERFEVSYDKYFIIDKKSDLIKFNSFLRKKPVFLSHDLVNDNAPNGSKFDLIICRNVLIYFNQNLQTKVVENFHNSLFDNGFILLGVHESLIGKTAHLFSKKGKVYQKI